MLGTNSAKYNIKRPCTDDLRCQIYKMKGEELMETNHVIASNYWPRNKDVQL